MYDILKEAKKLSDEEYIKILYEFRKSIDFVKLDGVGKIFYDGSDSLYIENCTIPNDILKNDKFFNDCKIEVMSSERPSVAHFHIINNSKKIYCAVCLDRNEYFIHKQYRDTLKKKAREELQDILLRNSPGKDITIWEDMCISWNENPNTRKIPTSLEYMPNYIDMTKSCH